tara:strand:- start:3644 stop:4663 length:1020 start_codon:yes stop_codon:yes gene_type:complete
MRILEIAKVFFSVIIVIILLEVISRVFLFFVTNNFNSFLYGIKNIEISTHSLKKFEIFLSEKNTKKIKLKFTENNDQEIWVFGSSNTEGKICNENIIPWPEDFSKYSNTEIKNFAKSNVFSDFSINVLRNKFQLKKYPKDIFWAHKLTEKRVATFGSVENREILKKNFEAKELIKNKMVYFSKAFALSLKKKFVSFYFFDEVALRIKIKYDLNIDRPIQINDNQKLDLIFYNFELNAEKAIKLAKEKNINFYFISLYSKNNFKKYKNNQTILFEKKYLNVVNKLINKYKNAFIIDLTKLEILNNADIYNKHFCDDVHLSEIGTKYLGKVIYEKFIQIKK